MAKRIMAVTVLALLLLAVSSPAVAELPDPSKGFNDLQWGQQIANDSAFTRIKDKGDADFFVRKDETFTLYGEKMRQVIYGAKDGKLFATYIHLDSKTLFEQLKTDLTKLYGQPKESSENDINILRWKKDSFKIKLKEYPLTDKLKLAFYNDTISSGWKTNNVESVMDDIYERELENFWIEGSPMLKLDN